MTHTLQEINVPLLTDARKKLEKSDKDKAPNHRIFEYSFVKLVTFICNFI